MRSISARVGLNSTIVDRRLLRLTTARAKTRKRSVFTTAVVLIEAGNSSVEQYESTNEQVHNFETGTGAKGEDIFLLAETQA
jgi:hypothetical protein